MGRSDSELARNRKAYHDYEIKETYETGICLVGTEIKSLRQNGASLQEAYVKILKGELWLIGCSIAPYSHGNVYNHEERRDRKLLMHKKEIQLLRKQIDQKGMTVVPLAIYLKKGRAKVKIGLARGKQSHDKRQAIRERDDRRRIDRAIKGRTG